MHAILKDIHYYLPPTVMTNHRVASLLGRSVAGLSEKTGVESWRVANEHECASDLGIAAAQRLFETRHVDRSDIDFLMFCTQTPDHTLPASACLIHARLGLPAHAGALDYNLGCSGYIYGLALAKGLIETTEAKKVLLITADTHSKLIGEEAGMSVQAYGDGASATLIEASSNQDLSPGIGSFVFGTDGTAADYLIVRNGGFRRHSRARANSKDNRTPQIDMNSMDLFESSMRVMPQLVHDVLGKAGLNLDDIKIAVFYQASKNAIELLRRRAGIPAAKVYTSMKDCGNVSSSNIPIALKRAADEGLLKKQDRILLAGFGSGLSWAGTVLTWAAEGDDPQTPEKPADGAIFRGEGNYAAN